MLARNTSVLPGLRVYHSNQQVKIVSAQNSTNIKSVWAYFSSSTTLVKSFCWTAGQQQQQQHSSQWSPPPLRRGCYPDTDLLSAAVHQQLLSATVHQQLSSRRPKNWIGTLFWPSASPAWEKNTFVWWMDFENKTHFIKSFFLPATYTLWWWRVRTKTGALKPSFPSSQAETCFKKCFMQQSFENFSGNPTNQEDSWNSND